MSRKLLVPLCIAAAALLGPPGAHANIVVDGGFEADTPGNPPNPPWVSNGSVIIDTTFPHLPSAQDAAFLDGGALSQTLPTVAGVSYVIDFWVLNEAGVPIDTFTASLGTFTLTPITGDLASSYSEFSATVPFADVGADAVLSFAATDPGGLSPWHLDDVSVDPVPTGVPEPGSIALLASGLVGLFGLAVTRRRGA